MAEPVAGAAGPGRFPAEAIRGVRARSAPAAACGMFADVTVDFEPSAAGVEVSLPDGLQVADGGTGSGVPYTHAGHERRRRHPGIPHGRAPAHRTRWPGPVSRQKAQVSLAATGAGRPAWAG